MMYKNWAIRHEMRCQFLLIIMRMDLPDGCLNVRVVVVNVWGGRLNIWFASEEACMQLCVTPFVACQECVRGHTGAVVLLHQSGDT